MRLVSNDRIPDPPIEYDLGGRHYTGQMRLVPRLFGGVIAEELVLYSDGRARWERCRRTFELQVKASR